MKFAVNCRSLDRCWHPLKASLITGALADTLKRAFKQLDKTFLDDL